MRRNRTLLALRCALVFFVMAAAQPPARAALVLREEIAPDVYAALKGGRLLYLECTPPQGAQAQAFLSAYLGDPKQWKTYKDRMAVAIPYHKLNAKTKRLLLETIFAEDYVDEMGWWHTVMLGPEEGVETWWTLAEWLTGQGTHYHAIVEHPKNRGLGTELMAGQRVLIPAEYLLAEMKTPTPGLKPLPPKEEKEEPEAEAVPDTTQLESRKGDLSYGKDGEGPYAIYRLQKGEALYTSVVARFTDYRENADILGACNIILKRSRVKDARRMEAGDKVLIPLNMLADRYQPEGSEQRQAHEAVRQEAQRLMAQPVRAKDLKDVVIILDPGHGGRDQGAALTSLGLFEDEISYDIVCRVKALLETQTGAKVYVTMKDPNQGYAKQEKQRFVHDTDEVVLTSPPYASQDARVSAHLRWSMANDIYRREIARGVDERKILFASIHCDMLYNVRLRGAMFYIPGAKYRPGTGRPDKSIYNRFKESRGRRNITTTMSQRRRDEALSHNFSEILVKTLATNNPPIKVHGTGGDAIRNVIRQSGGQAYLPAVLRYNLVPTKILVETANMTNPTDQKRVANPKWRQWFAEAFVKAVRKHFES